MRVLCTVWAVSSHLRPLLPVVRALLDAGDEVVVVTTEALAGAVAATGARVEPILRDPDPAGEPTDEPLEHGSPKANALAQVLAGARLREQVPGILALARDFGAELIIRDDSEFTGYLVGEVLGLPVVCLAGAMSNHFDTAAMATVLDGYRRRLGLPALLDPRGLYPGPILDYLPEQLSVAANKPERALRFREPWTEEPGERLPEALASAPPERPVVFAAIGTAWRTWQRGGGPGGGSGAGPSGGPAGSAADPVEEDLRLLLDALSEVDCTALVSTGGLDGVELPHADHVTVLDFAPQRLVLRCAQLFCTHGGYNSIRESLGAGVPMLVRPSVLDQPANARAVVELGLGSVATGLDRAELAALLRRSLADTGLAARARAAQRALLALPGIDTAPAALRALR